jgi:hypothetical protein
MINSVEGTILHAVLEGRTEAAAERIHEQFLDGELRAFRDNVETLLDLISAEISARTGPRLRRLQESTPVADTGETHIVRGRE